jgi:hypothetical protein
VLAKLLAKMARRRRRSGKDDQSTRVPVQAVDRKQVLARPTTFLVAQQTRQQIEQCFRQELSASIAELFDLLRMAAGGQSGRFVDNYDVSVRIMNLRMQAWSHIGEL